MNKSLKALLLGYIFFRVAGRTFFRYNSARAYMGTIPKPIPVSINGFCIFKGWRCFYLRTTWPEFSPPQITTYNPK